MTDDPKAPILKNEGSGSSYGCVGPGSSQDLENPEKVSGPPQEKLKLQAPKKKQPGFLSREIMVTNPTDVDKATLLQTMHERFVKSFEKWKRRAQIFKFANLVVTLTVILIQLAQVILFQVPGVQTDLKNSMATVLPAITGSILAIQLKLAWAEKGAKSKKSARLFHTLVSHTEYRMKMEESGGETPDIDVVKLWNTALLSESKDIPAFLLPY